MSNPEDPQEPSKPKRRGRRKKGAGTGGPARPFVRDTNVQLKLLGGTRFNYVKRIFDECLADHSKSSDYDPSNYEAIHHCGAIIEKGVKEYRNGAHKWIAGQSFAIKISGSELIAVIKMFQSLVNDIATGKRKADDALLQV